MNKKIRAVPLTPEHKHGSEGVDQMDTKIIMNGNTKIIIHSDLINLTEAEREQKLQKMWNEKHPSMLRIAAAMSEVVQRSSTN